MKLPNLQDAVVSKVKVVDYLLSPSHPIGRHKAAFFRSHGFWAGHWEQLASALRQHAELHEVTSVEVSSFGTRYIIEGTMQTPDGRMPQLRTVWFLDELENVPRLVSAYPLNRRKQ